MTNQSEGPAMEKAIEFDRGAIKVRLLVEQRSSHAALDLPYPAREADVLAAGFVPASALEAARAELATEREKEQRVCKWLETWLPKVGTMVTMIDQPTVKPVVIDEALPGWRFWLADGSGYRRDCHIGNLLPAQPAAPSAPAKVEQASSGEAAGDGVTHVCKHCKDTHFRETERGREMCTGCPLPCPKCRAGGQGAYCETTPCSCDCHGGERGCAKHGHIYCDECRADAHWNRIRNERNHYRDRALQSEREAIELRKELETAKLKAQTRELDLAELAAQRDESDRKLTEAQAQLALAESRLVETSELARLVGRYIPVDRSGNCFAQMRRIAADLIKAQEPTEGEPAKPPAPVSQFKVGQLVRVTQDEHRGEIGTVKDYDSGRTWPYAVTFGNGYTRRFVAESLEPADPTPSAAYDAEAQAILDESKASSLRDLPEHICQVIMLSPKDDPLWIAVRGALIGLSYSVEDRIAKADLAGAIRKAIGDSRREMPTSGCKAGEITLGYVADELERSRS